MAVLSTGELGGLVNICFVCRDYPPAHWGGIEVFTQTLARGLVARGHRVSVVGYSTGAEAEIEEEDHGVHILRLPPVKRGILPAVLPVHLRLEAAIRRVVRQAQMDLVECPDVGGSLMMGHLGAPLVVRMHGANLVYFPATGRKPLRWVSFFEKRTLRLADHLVAVSRYIRDATLAMTGLGHRPCALLYNGVDTARFYPRPEIKRDPNRILYVGRPSETKGAPNLFRALPAIFDRLPEAHLRFVGSDPINSAGVRASEILLADFPERWRSHVEIVGSIPHEQLPIEYQQAGAAVFPSRIESWGIAICEAMACGTPVVFMKHGPGPEMIEDGQEGLLCDTSSPDAIADATIELLLRPQWAQAMGTRAAERIASTLSLESAIERNEAFYRHCLEEAAR